MKTWVVLCVALVMTGMVGLSTADQLNDRALNGRVTTEPMAMAIKAKVSASDEKFQALKKKDADLKTEAAKVPMLERNDEELKSKVAKLEQADEVLNSRMIHLEKVVALQNRMHTLMRERRSAFEAKKGGRGTRQKRKRFKKAMNRLHSEMNRLQEEKEEKNRLAKEKEEKIKKKIKKTIAWIRESVQLKQFACIRKSDVHSLDNATYGKKSICDGEDGFPKLEKKHFVCTKAFGFCRLRMKCDCSKDPGNQRMNDRTAECICAKRCADDKKSAIFKLKTENGHFIFDINPNEGQCSKTFAYCFEKFRGRLSKIVTRQIDKKEEEKEFKEDAGKSWELKAARREHRLLKKQYEFCDADGSKEDSGSARRRRLLVKRGGTAGC